MTIQREIDQERLIDPTIAALTILDPGENLFHVVEESGQLQQRVKLSHARDPVCPDQTSRQSPRDGPTETSYPNRERSRQRRVDHDVRGDPEGALVVVS